MKNNRYIFITLFISVLASFMWEAKAQLVTGNQTKIDVDSIRRDLDHGPYFTLFKDNYFTIGTALGEKPDKHNSDVKFQISISQRLTKSTLPFNSYLFLAYSQKVWWNIFENSLPMRDLNFNPGIGLARWLFFKNRLIGKAILMVEHESNGRDSIWSRSWNKISLGANIFIDPQLMVHGKIWIPIIDGVENRDILKYSGIFQVGMQYMSNNKRFGAAITLIKRQSWNPFNWNTIFELNYRIFKKENQFLFLQYYNGFGENMLDYNKFHSRLRVGLVIKPSFFSDF